MYGTVRGTPAGSAAGQVDRAIPWPEVADGWTPADRLEYGRALRRDGTRAATAVRAPALLRESLLSLGGESPEDDEVRRELRRLPAPGAG